MNSSIQNPKPNDIVQLSPEASKRNGQSSTWCNPPGCFTFVASLAGFFFLLFSAPSARANQHPVGDSTNGFIPFAGTFNGLFFDTNGVHNYSSGFFTLKGTASGTYTASLYSEGRKYSVSGKFSPDGKATNGIPRRGTSSLIVRWDAHESKTISGTVTDKRPDKRRWVSPLMGNYLEFNARTNPAPQAGRYTLIIPGTPGANDSPEGDGCATVTVNGNGIVSFAGRLADGTKVAQKVSISENGEWPLYVSVYSGRGSLMGWVLFTNGTSDDVSGKLSWIRPTFPMSKFYPAGFEVDSDLAGSRYVAAVGMTNRVLEISNGVVILSGGNLSDIASNNVVLDLKGKVTDFGPNRLILNITLSSGLFKGTLIEAGATRKINLNGAVLQKANYGSGYFTGTSQNGRVILRAAP